ncbi:MAG: metal ABC transporter permease [Methanoculleaceae archaeon]
MTDLLSSVLFQHAIIAGLLASVACGMIGTYVVLRKIATLSGGISHSAFGGIGLGYWAGIEPLVGALVVALCSALSMDALKRKGVAAEDTIISVLWAAGMAIGILFISITPGYAPDLLTYLFGNILLVSSTELWLMIFLDTLIAIIIILLYHQIVAVSFDEEFATITGIPVAAIDTLMLVLTALSVVMLIRVVGVILVIALLTIPAAIASRYLSCVWQIILVAIAIGILSTMGGIGISVVTGAPSGASIILFATVLFVLNALNLWRSGIS